MEKIRNKSFSPKQKFFRGQRVLISTPTAPFEHPKDVGCEAIVVGSYADQYGGQDHSSFTLLVFQTQPRKYMFTCSWYDVSALTLLSDDRGSGELLIQQYNERYEK